MTANPSSLDRDDVPVEGDLLLPRPPGVVRRFWYRHPRLADALIAAVFTVPAAASALLVNCDTVNRPWGLAALGAVFYALGGAALLFRRRRPWLVLVVAWIVSLIGVPMWNVIDVTLVAFALYALAVYGSVRAAWIGLAGSAVIASAGSAIVVALTRDDKVVAAAGNFSQVIFLLIVVLIAINIGNRRRYVVALVDRAAQLARERDQQSKLATADERARIAREMHDIVSHGLTVMVTLAEGSAATAKNQPENAADAMRQVAETGRRALIDMRRMLGLLDDGLPGDLTPQPAVADLSALVERFRATGLGVLFSTEGTPPTESAEQLAIYRLVQESLTNVLRHGVVGASATVALRYEPTAVSIAVTNTGPVVDPAAPGVGRGTVGMRERVALYGGTVESAPRPDGGWSVIATLTHDAPPSVETEQPR